ncbi:MAG TPA: lipopolysaccharide assembly protein LapA domain-containing protein [Methylocella sp.]|nr:lipopolysaccharide assembly protein LapA domain-containing protein [Methylocella sp.]
MKSFFKYLFLIPIALIVLALAAANRHSVTIFLDPFASHTPEGTQIVAPLYIVMLLAAMAGIILGGVTTWLEQGKYRRAARRARSEANALRGDLARLSSGRPAEKRKIS